GLVVRLTDPAAVTGIGAVAVRVGAAAAGRPRGEVGMRAHPGSADIARAVVAVARAPRVVGLVVRLADPAAVTGIWVVAVRVGAAAARRLRGEVGMRAHPGSADIARAVVAVARAPRVVGLVV